MLIIRTKDLDTYTIKVWLIASDLYISLIPVTCTARLGQSRDPARFVSPR